MIVASKSELTIRHCVEDLGKICQIKCFLTRPHRSLAETVVIPTTFAFFEKVFQTLCHVDPKEAIKVTDHR